MTSPNVTVNRKAKRSPGRWANLAITALVLCLGPMLIVVGTLLIKADDELVRTGEQVPGVVTVFNDESKASQRKIKVEFQSGDGFVHYTWVTVDHDQHPVVGEDVTVVYRESDPGNATVLGYESDGVFFRGAGVVLTAIFGGIGVFLFISYLLGWRKDRRKRAG
ncbi:DUF3592 domain-containing protein [Arthrobacter sp. LjRoot78]|uniref:DUF3592 domain-containing protein n=1 Tax=Arthrobacter sp. LjRoot78 TaxID=3342338 RepID=UPI003ECCBF09